MYEDVSHENGYTDEKWIETHKFHSSSMKSVVTTFYAGLQMFEMKLNYDSLHENSSLFSHNHNAAGVYIKLISYTNLIIFLFTEVIERWIKITSHSSCLVHSTTK